MVRTQISLTPAQYNYLKTSSEKTGESLSSMIRRAIEHLKKVENTVLRPYTVIETAQGQ